MKSHLSVKLVRSTIGTSVLTVANTPSFRGMVKKVLHLVEVEEVSAPASTATPAKS